MHPCKCLTIKGKSAKVSYSFVVQKKKRDAAVAFPKCEQFTAPSQRSNNNDNALGYWEGFIEWQGVMSWLWFVVRDNQSQAFCH